MSDTEAKPEEGNEPITIRVKDQTGAFCFYIVDNYVDPGQHPSNPVPDTVDSVDGTFTVSVSLVYATGILVPLSLGNFSVTLPIVTISAIAP